jgi:hypothetical protein
MSSILVEFSNAPEQLQFQVGHLCTSAQSALQVVKDKTEGTVI